MSALATPETSQVLLVDPLTLFLDHLEDCLAMQVKRRFQLLVSAAYELVIPRYHAVSVVQGVPQAGPGLAWHAGTIPIFRITY